MGFDQPATTLSTKADDHRATATKQQHQHAEGTDGTAAAAAAAAVGSAQQHQQATMQMPPHMRLVAAKMTSMMLDVVVRLGIPDLIKDRVVSVDELVASCHAVPDRLYRLLRALTNEGVFVEHPNRCFALGDVGQFFRHDHPMSCADTTLWLCGETHSRVWLSLMDAVKTGRPAAPDALGMGAFEYFERHPRVLHNFQGCMTELSKFAVPAIIQAYGNDWTKFKTICDVGGGHGFMLSQILNAAGEGSEGILYEMQRVIAQAPEDLKEFGAPLERIQLVSGDFFSAVPRGVDLYVMKAIIHDHDDDKCIKILSLCREGLNANGRILVMDAVVPGMNEPSFAKVIDIEMMAMVTGRERTKEEFADLFKRAGLQLTRIVQC